MFVCVRERRQESEGKRVRVRELEKDRARDREREYISTRRAIVGSRWDSEKYTNGSFRGKIQRGEGPRISILMDMNNV